MHGAWASTLTPVFVNTSMCSIEGWKADSYTGCLVQDERNLLLLYSMWWSSNDKITSLHQQPFKSECLIKAIQTEMTCKLHFVYDHAWNLYEMQVCTCLRLQGLPSRVVFIFFLPFSFHSFKKHYFLCCLRPPAPQITAGWYVGQKHEGHGQERGPRGSGVGADKNIWFFIHWCKLTTSAVQSQSPCRFRWPWLWQWP